MKEKNQNKNLQKTKLGTIQFLIYDKLQFMEFFQAVLPECRVTNFTTDWNSGIFLSALLDYCEPGLFPHWKHIDPNDR